MARCHALRLDNPEPAASGGGTGAANPSAAGSGPKGGYSPSDLQSAYNLAGASGTGTIAIVDAYDDPDAESDLAYYRQYFGLSPCTTTSGCFKKVDQNGGTNYPSGDGSWAQEISLDLDMASAVCPGCKILLVEANSNYFTDLGTAVNEAASPSLGADAINNSYGGVEFSGETSDESSYYDHPGIAVTASSGDSGYGVSFPASSQYVTAVGGTTLGKASNTPRGWSETVWGSAAGGPGTGSGCSAFIQKPSWQKDVGCGMRTVGDVAAVADPYSGVSVYDTYSDAYESGTGWMVFGGTSASSAIIASVYALTGNASTLTYGSYPYGHTSSLNDVTSGSNGSCPAGAASGTAASSQAATASPQAATASPQVARHHHRRHGHGGRHGHRHKRSLPSPPPISPSPPPISPSPSPSPSPSLPPSEGYLCTGESGYDGPTGNGTPNGTGAF